MDCDPDLNPDSGPGARVNVAYNTTESCREVVWIAMENDFPVIIPDPIVWKFMVVLAIGCNV